MFLNNKGVLMPKTHKRRFIRSKQHYPYIAAKLREYGCHAVPVPQGTKKCLIKGWPTTFTDNEFEKICKKHSEDGVGIVLGACSQLMAVDNDLDLNDPFQNLINNHLEHLIPESPVERKGSKAYARLYQFNSDLNYSKSHMLFDPFKKQWVELKPLELLSTSHLLVMPPSIHPNGINYIYTKGSEDDFADKSKFPILPHDFIEQYEAILERIKTEFQPERIEAASAKTKVAKIEPSALKDVGRNNKLKSIAVAALKNGTPTHKVAAELVAYDSKHHHIPLFTDPTEGNSDDPAASSSDFVKRIDRSVSRKASDLFITLEDLKRRKDFEKLNYLVEGLLTIPGVSILAGKPKIGKTTLLLDTMVNVIKGENVFERTSHETNILFITLENNLNHLKEYFSAKLGSEKKDQIIFSVKPVYASDIEAIKETIKKHKIGLVVIDTLAKFLKCSDLNDYGKMTAEMDRLNQLAADANVHILTTHHTVKSTDSRGVSSVLGSTAVTASVDTIFSYDGNKSQTSRNIKSEQRYGKPIDLHLDFNLEKMEFTLLCGDEVQSESKTKKAILKKLLESKKPITRAELGLTVRKQVVTDSLNNLILENKIICSGKGTKGDRKLYSVPLDKH